MKSNLPNPADYTDADETQALRSALAIYDELKGMLRSTEPGAVASAEFLTAVLIAQIPVWHRTEINILRARVTASESLVGAHHEANPAIRDRLDRIEKLVAPSVDKMWKLIK